MPTDPKQYQESLLPWSRWKHAILIEYLKAMSAIMRSWESIFYVDGFAGPGKYTKDDAIGSPVLAAKHAQELARTNAQYALQCINVELDNCVFQNLERSTTQYSDYVTNRHGDFGQYVAEILGIIGDKPTLFFLDPIGLKGLEWQALLPIFHRDAKTELLIRFDAQTATRLTGNEESLHSTFNSILGEDSSDYWLKCVASYDDGAQRKRDRLTKAYEDKLIKHFPYVGRIPILSSDDALKYYLLFATKSLKGMQVMNDVCFATQGLRDRTLDAERKEAGIGQQMSFFDLNPEDEILRELKALKQAVLVELEEVDSTVRDELRGLVASRADNFGRFSGSQFTAVLGGRPRSLSVPKEFENLKARIQIHNGLTPGNDKVEISLMR
ncbi:MAG: three-Cys-motif partner protein TcmP [Chloroflexota bacterium]|nr:three-Cys-motif partner protein TcmP [Chloroflexota bacterium]MDE2909729.1 three-Cys-motif partner protein TcmP [Chloroflexota bacterium]